MFEARDAKCDPVTQKSAQTAEACRGRAVAHVTCVQENFLGPQQVSKKRDLVRTTRFPVPLSLPNRDTRLVPIETSALERRHPGIRCVRGMMCSHHPHAHPLTNVHPAKAVSTAVCALACVLVSAHGHPSPVRSRSRSARRTSGAAQSSWTRTEDGEYPTSNILSSRQCPGSEEMACR